MKYIVGISLLVSIFILSGCNISNIQSNHLSKNELFEKKKECITYKSSIEKDIKKRLIENNYGKWSYDEYIEEIFYSEEMNSCFAVTNIDSDNGVNNTTSKRIIDLLTTEENYYSNIYNTGNNGYNGRIYNEYISKLKSDL